MKYPKFLEEKENIICMAPSFGCNTEPYRTAFDNAQKKWKGMGYNVILGPNCYQGNGIGISNSPDICGKEINEFMTGVKEGIVISCGGGELMCETISHVDFTAISAAKPKWFMGFSDNTNLTFLLTTLCDIASIYGPCAPSFGMEPWAPLLYDVWDLVRGKKLSFKGYDKWEKDSLKDEKHPLATLNMTEDKKLVCFKPESGKLVGDDLEINFNGRMLGGCLDCLANLCGTRFDEVKEFSEKYREDGLVWYLEACDLNVFDIRRAVWKLKEAGWFKYAKGFIIGRPYAAWNQEMMGLNQYGAVTDVLADIKVPVVMDADLGHFAPSMPMINGGLANVEIKHGNIFISYELK